MKFRLATSSRMDPTFGAVVEWNLLASSTIIYVWRWVVVLTVWWIDHSTPIGGNKPLELAASDFDECIEDADDGYPCGKQRPCPDHDKEV